MVRLGMGSEKQPHGSLVFTPGGLLIGRIGAAQRCANLVGGRWSSMAARFLYALYVILRRGLGV